MMALHRKKKQEAKAEEMKNEVKLLKRRHDATLERERKLRDDINSGDLKPATAYRLPLSTLPSPSNALNSRNTTLAVEDLRVLRNTALSKQQLEAHAIGHGVTCWRGESPEEHIFAFDPYVMGRHYGPYELRLKFVNSRMVLKGHSLPHDVPTVELYKKTGRGDNTRPFILTIAAHLRAVISRQQQIEELKERYPDEVKEVMCSNKGTCLVIKLMMQEELSGTKHEIKIDMTYDRAADRPKTLAVESVGEDVLTKQEEKELRRQCRVFFAKRLASAVAAAFNA